MMGDELTRLPDLTRKVLGYRAFGLSEEGDLTAIALGHRWIPGVNRARCLAGGRGGGFGYQPWAAGMPQADHEAPQAYCACGIYAMHAPTEEWRRPGAFLHAIGAVILAWGRMEVHLNGFRAEYAEIVRLFYDPYSGPSFTDRVDAAAARYGVPSGCIEDLDEQALEQLGAAVPMSLRPTEKWLREREASTIPSAALQLGPAAMQLGHGPPPGAASGIAAFPSGGVLSRGQFTHTVHFTIPPMAGSYSAPAVPLLPRRRSRGDRIAIAVGASTTAANFSLYLWLHQVTNLVAMSICGIVTLLSLRRRRP